MSAGHSFVLDVADATSGMIGHRVEVDPRDVVFVKGLIEASEGLASVFAVSGGSLTIAAPTERNAELIELLGDIERCSIARVLGPAPVIVPESTSGRSDG